MKHSLKIMALASSLTSAPAFAETATPKVLVETDPVTFAMAGYSAHVRLPLRQSGVVLGAGVYGMKLPDLVAEFHPKNDGRDFHVELDKSYAGFFDYHFSGAPEGLFVGVQAALQRHRITQGATSPSTEVGVALVMPRVGVLWHPFDHSGFYVLPWLGAGPAFELYRTSDTHDDYHSLPVLAFGTFHLGWYFR